MNNKEKLENMCMFVVDELSDVAEKARELNVTINIQPLGNDHVQWEASGLRLFKAGE